MLFRTAALLPLLTNLFAGLATAKTREIKTVPGAYIVELADDHVCNS
jgi:hypothetical protein